MECTNYEVTASDYFTYVIAKNAKQAMEIARNLDPHTEVHAVRRGCDDDRRVRYVVISEKILGFLIGDTGEAVVLRNRSQTAPALSGPMRIHRHCLRHATVHDFRKFRISIRGKYLIYSSNEAAILDGSGFWNDRIGYVDLETAQVFSEGEHLSGDLPQSTGDDARFFPAGAFL